MQQFKLKEDVKSKILRSPVVMYRLSAEVAGRTSVAKVKEWLVDNAPELTTVKALDIYHDTLGLSSAQALEVVALKLEV